MHGRAPICAMALAVAACEFVAGIDERVLAPQDGGGGEATCMVGQRRACYEGAPQTREVGACREGEQICNADGWGSCEGWQGPVTESCDEAVDLDCDGEPACLGEPRWLNGYGDAGDQLMRDGIVLEDGRFVVVGVFGGTISFGASNLVSLGGYDIFVAAFEPDGAVSWARSFGGPGGTPEFFDMVLAPDGDVIVGGTLDGQATFDDVTLAPDGQDGVAWRMSPDGEVRWARLYGGAGDQLIRGVGADPRDGGTFVLAGHYDTTFSIGGTTHQATTFRRVVHLRIDGGGTPRWSADYGGSDDVFGGAVVIAEDGGIWSTGNADDTVDFGGGELVPAGQVVKTSFLAHHAADGAHVGSWIHGVSGLSQGEEIALLPQGDVILSGAITTSGQVDFGDGVQGGDVPRQLFVARFDRQGAPVATRLVAGGLGTPALRIDAEGFITLGALYSGLASFGGEPLPPLNDWDVALVKYGPMLEHRWSWAGRGPGRDDVYALGVDGDGRIFAAGRFAGSFELGELMLTGAGQSDLWVGGFDP